MIEMNDKKNKKLAVLLLTVLLAIPFLSLCLVPDTVYAANQYIIDEAGLLTSEEENDLNQLLIDYSLKHQIDIVVTTRTGLDGKSDKQYLEDFVDEVLDQGIYSENIVILQFDINERICTIQAYGSAQHVIDDDNIEYILDVVCPQITDGDYYYAFTDFSKGVNHYYSDKNYEFGLEPLFFQLWFQILLSLIIGGISVGCMAYSSTGRNTVNNHTYLDEQHSGIVARRDDYIRTIVSKRKKPSDHDGGGRSSGGSGISSGGRSHSGGSRSC